MEKNETIETIYTRRSVRKFQEKEVDRKLIDKIIEAGRMAPSAINMQPWKFYVLTNKVDIKEFSKAIRSVSFKQVFKMGIKKLVKTAVSAIKMSHGIDFHREDDPVFHGAPVVVFITGDKDNEWAALDIGMCVQNMLLAAKSMGLDSCPIGFAKFVDQTELYPRLKVSNSEKVLLAIIVGYGDETPEVHKRITDNVYFIE